MVIFYPLLQRASVFFPALWPLLIGHVLKNILQADINFPSFTKDIRYIRRTFLFVLLIFIFSNFLEKCPAERLKILKDIYKII